MMSDASSGAISTVGDAGAAFTGALEALTRLPGVSMAAVVDAASGECVACREGAFGPWSEVADADASRARRSAERAARFVAAHTVARARDSRSQGRLPVETVLSLRYQCHLLRAIPAAAFAAPAAAAAAPACPECSPADAAAASLYVYLAYDRESVSPSQARERVVQAAAALSAAPPPAVCRAAAA